MKILSSIRAAFLRWWNFEEPCEPCSRCGIEWFTWDLYHTKADGNNIYCPKCFNWLHGEGGETW